MDKCIKVFQDKARNPKLSLQQKAVLSKEQGVKRRKGSKMPKVLGACPSNARRLPMQKIIKNIIQDKDDHYINLILFHIQNMTTKTSNCISLTTKKKVLMVAMIQDPKTVTIRMSDSNNPLINYFESMIKSYTNRMQKQRIGDMVFS